MFLQRRTSTGLDIGEYNVKFSIIEADGGRIRNLWHEEVMPERQSQNDALDEATLRERLETLGASVRMKFPNVKKPVSTPIQGESVVCQYLELPQVSPKELDLAVNSMARRHVPFPMESVSISYMSVPQLSRGAKRSAVFFIAVEKSAVQRMQTLVSTMGFELKRPEITPLALVREFSRNHDTPKDQFTALLHIGFRQTYFIVLRQHNPYYVRNFTPAGRDFTYAFQMGNQSSWEAAEHVKRNYNCLDRDVSVEPFLLRWLEEVKRSMEFFRTQVLSADDGVSQVFMSGGGGRVAGAGRAALQRDRHAGRAGLLGPLPAHGYRLAARGRLPLQARGGRLPGRLTFIKKGGF